MELYADVTNFVLPPVGNHPAICCGVVYCGHVNGTYKGHPKKTDTVYLLFELTDTNHVFKPEKGPEPFVVLQKYSNTMGADSNLRKMLQGWRGAPFTDDEAKRFNIFSIVKAPCIVNLIKKTAAGSGKERVEVYSVSQIMAGMAVPALRTKIVEWKMPNLKKGEVFDTEGFNNLHKFIQEDIKKSDEYAAMANNLPVQQAGQVQQQQLNPFGQPQQSAQPTTSGNALPF